ncbi:hypothetical protein LOD99_15110 [Oopsacas minuta]|uniref:MULE transposase domain-containing protein n=1 Tax=Oopsacas minuta TaxID=111878 RepID=A0AAV7KD40_9METZ|nr:hypothetical protein LOD99_15110 [Oopsacas minuta]
MEFYSVTTCNSGSQMSIDTVDSIPEQHSFIEENLTEIRKPLFKLTMKAARNRLNVLLKHIQFVAQREQVDEKKVAALALELISNQEYDRETSSICKEIIATGTYGNVKKVSIPMSSYIIDLLEIGAFKYTQLKKLLKQDIVFPSYKVLSQYRQEISLSRSVLFVTNPEGLDTHSIILFGFKILSITDNTGFSLYVNTSPNSPFSFRAVCLIALKENHENVKFIMDTLVNPATKLIVEQGIAVENRHINVEIIRSIFDTKMAGLLDEAGDASCHLCTATGNEINSLECARSGFPINRYITDANQLFDDINEDEIFALPSKKRCGITHHPTSEINILAASPLHAYLCVFRWYMLNIYHLDAGCKKWSPTCTKVQDSLKRIRSIIDAKCSIKIDIPSSQGGTSTTGNVARDCF